MGCSPNQFETQTGLVRTNRPYVSRINSEIKLSVLVNAIKRFQNFIDTTSTWTSISSKQGLSELEFYGALMYKFGRIVGQLCSGRYRIIRYKTTVYNINVMGQTACLLVDAVTVNNVPSLFNCSPIVLQIILSGPLFGIIGLIRIYSSAEKSVHIYHCCSRTNFMKPNLVYSYLV